MSEYEQKLLQRVSSGKNLANAALDLQGELNEEAAAELHWGIPAHGADVRNAISSIAKQKGIKVEEVNSYIKQVAKAGDPAAISLMHS